MSPGLWVGTIFLGGIVFCIICCSSNQKRVSKGKAPKTKFPPDDFAYRKYDHPSLSASFNRRHADVQEEIDDMKRIYYSSGANDPELFAAIQDAEIEAARRALDSPEIGPEDIHQLRTKLATLEALKKVEEKSNLLQKFDEHGELEYDEPAHLKSCNCRRGNDK